MTDPQRRLWEAICRFPIDDPAARLPFSGRLARDNGWSPGFARRVVEEYRRFLFLAVEAGHPVTPSDEVDQAWHLHLVYTESYWNGLCAEVLGRPLHHGPTRGGPSEGSKYRDWYAQTLASYRRLFGSPPPADIWRDPEARFASAAHFRRVNTRNHWVIPRPRIDRRAARLAAPALLLLATSGCAFSGLLLGQGMDTSVAIAFGLVMIVVIGTVVLVKAVGGGRPAKSRPPGSSDRSDGDLFWDGGDGGHDGGGHDAGDSGCGGGDSGCGGGCGGCGGGDRSPARGPGSAAPVDRSGQSGRPL